MACLDTSLLIDLCRGGNSRRHTRAVGKLAELTGRGEPLTTTRFNVAELYVGVCRASDEAREERRVQSLLECLAVIEFDAAASRLYARITAHLQLMGRPSGDMDALIAATALLAQETIVTANPSHFENMPGVSVEAY